MEEPKAMLLLIQEFVLAWKQQTNGWSEKAKRLHVFAKAWACCVQINKCCILCVLTATQRHNSPAPDVNAPQVLTLVRLRSQPRAEASLRAAEVLFYEPLKQFSFLIFLIPIQDFGFECCRFWLTLPAQAHCGLEQKNALKRALCKWGRSHCWMKV